MKQFFIGALKLLGSLVALVVALKAFEEGYGLWVIVLGGFWFVGRQIERIEKRLFDTQQTLDRLCSRDR